MPDVAQETVDLLFLGLDHAVDSIRDGGPLITFVITERGGERDLVRYVDKTIEGSIANAVERISASPIGPGDRCVLVYDGFLTMPDGGRFDAIYAEVIDFEGTVTIMAQRYRPKATLRRFETIGNPALLPGAKGKL